MKNLYTGFDTESRWGEDAKFQPRCNTLMHYVLMFVFTHPACDMNDIFGAVRGSEHELAETVFRLIESEAIRNINGGEYYVVSALGKENLDRWYPDLDPDRVLPPHRLSRRR